ncbi:MAG TPA: membrane protease subunit, stomatin/prohibitin, partial [Microscillaceae bacterium]|nr:membrane protease subunit, stomatin/prohibitin [Microscillaceae bacterium]
MFGINYIKFDSTTYVIHYVKGKIRKEGRGLSFFYFAWNSSIAAIATGSNDVPFFFNCLTADFQTISVQGQITYRVANPKQLAELLDFSVDRFGHYKTNDNEKISLRLNVEAQAAIGGLVQQLSLKEALRSAKPIEENIKTGLVQSDAIKMLGIEPLSVNIAAVKATPEMERALEAETREALQQESDKAVYDRRNFAVVQERTIKENELNTEIAVEEKRKQIVEKQMEIQEIEQTNHKKIALMEVDAKIAVEIERQKLIDLETTNQRKQAETQGFALETTL